MARRKQQKYPPWAVAAVLVVCVVAGVLSSLQHRTPAQTQQTAAHVQPGSAQVYFLDVGQGDSQLIRLKSGKTILIDAGTGETAKKLTDYLKQLGIKRIDYLVATHPHADHIGGMAQVVNSLDIGDIYMPKIPDKQVPTTATYENLLKAIDKKGLKITAAKAGMTILDSGDEKLVTLAPNAAKYSDLNNYSVVTKLTVGSKSFLFAGDAETDSEKEMVAKGFDLKADVLKLGHHGSSTSTGAAFLKAVNPSSAIVSCGVNNDYGHPHRETISRLQKAGVTIYRTDKQDTILALCDGKSIEFKTNQKSVIKP